MAALAAPAPAWTATTLRVAGIGFAGSARLGAWAPVWVDVEATATAVDGLVVVEAAAPSGLPAVRFAAPVRAAPGARVRVFVPAVISIPRAPGVVFLLEDGRTVASTPLPAVRPADAVVVVLSTEPVGVEAEASARRLAVAYMPPEMLPPAWQAYEGARVVAVRDLDERRLDDAQRQALWQWVWAGGHVVAMPAGEDARHLSGATLRPLGSGTGTPGFGRFSVWPQDPASPAARASTGVRARWAQALERAPGPSVPAPPLPPGRGVPVRIQILVGAFTVAYLLALWRFGGLPVRAGAVGWLALGAFIAAATGAGVLVAREARAAISGVVAAAVVEVIGGTGHGLLSAAVETVPAHGGGFTLRARRDLLLRPDPPAPVTIIRGDEIEIQGRGGVRLLGQAIVPARVSGTFDAAGVVEVSNRSADPIHPAWVYAGGRVHRVGAVTGTVRISLDPEQWQPPTRQVLAGPGNLLLVWAFSRLEAGAILKAPPAWLVGWQRAPGGGLRWDGRPEGPPHLILVPLTPP